MMIPILPQLENRAQWVAFFQRERPYAQIREPNCRVDLQTTFLQITCFGAQPVRFTLGSKTTLEPVWQIISRCNWSLKVIINGLAGIEGGTAVRDRELTDWSPDLSVRRSIPREQHLYAEAPLGAWPKPSRALPLDSIDSACALIAWNLYTNWESTLTPMQWLLLVEASPEGWEAVTESDERLALVHPNLPTARFKPQL